MSEGRTGSSYREASLLKNREKDRKRERNLDDEMNIYIERIFIQIFRKIER